MSTSYICRDLRHAWSHYKDEVTDKRRGKIITFKRFLVCERCETTRTDTFAVTRKAILRKKTVYHYDKSYRLPKGTRLEDIRYQLFISGEL